MSIIIEAARAAHKAHAGQKRKYHGGPFIEHPMRVAGRVALLHEATEEMVAAAWLHDVVEDTAVTIGDLELVFPDRVTSLVAELTKRSAGCSPEMSREDRHAMDIRWYGMVSREARTIKAIDRADNLRDMVSAPNDQKAAYVHESMVLAMVIRKCDDTAIASLWEAIRFLDKTLPCNIRFMELETHDDIRRTT